MNDLKTADQQKADAFLEDFSLELARACCCDKDTGISGRKNGCSADLLAGFLDHLEHKCCGDYQAGRQFLIRSIQ
jgi:hypothetical protein